LSNLQLFTTFKLYQRITTVLPTFVNRCAEDGKMRPDEAPIAAC
jgi:hypothetical protein